MSVVGKWRNEYGSILDIRSQGPGGGLSGVYTSETGATGTYLMAGWSPPSPSGAENRPVSACVAWKPTDSDEHDPSWNWVSIMAGVVFLDGPGAAPRLQMLHGLVASTPLSAVSIERPGVYVETLTFEQLAEPADPREPVSDDLAIGPVSGPPPLILTNRDSASRFRDIRLVIDADGRAQATINLADKAAPAQGFVDASPAGDLRSLALSASIGGDASPSITLGGFIDAGRRVAVLQVFEARAVTYQNKYTAVIASQETFSVAVGQ